MPGFFAITTSEGIYIYDDYGAAVSYSSLGDIGLESKEKISSIFFRKNGEILVGCDNGKIVFFSNGGLLKSRSTNLVSTFFKSPIRSISVTSSYALIAIDSGLFITEAPPNEDALTSYKKIKNDPSIRKMFATRDTIWIASLSGLFHFSFSAFRSVDELSQNSSDIVFSFAQESENEVWIATYDSILSYDLKTNTAHPLHQIQGLLESDHSGISTIAIDENVLWIGYLSNGVRKVDLDTGQTKHLEINPDIDVSITNLAIDSNFSSMWIATYNDGLFKVSTATLDITRVNLAGSIRRPITHISPLSNGTLFTASEDGLYSVERSDNSANALKIEFENLESPPMIYSSSENDEGQVWIGTKSNGLFQWNSAKNATSQYLARRPENSLPETTTVYSIEIDQYGRLWCSTDSGVYLLSPTGSLLSRFTKASGLVSNDFNDGASFKDVKGNIYFGSSQGFSIINPEANFKDRLRSTIVIRSANLRNDKVEFVQSDRPADLFFRSNQMPLKIDFSTLDFIDPSKNQYRYILEDFDTEWIDSGARNFATYTNLPPGDYTFRVQGANSSGVWNREGASLDITVLPPPWRTWWAYCLYCIFSGVIIWLLHRVYHSYVIDRKAAELAYEMHLTEERAEDDMQEQVELQERIVHTAYHRNMATLSLIDDFLGNESASTEKSQLSKEAVLRRRKRRLSALSILEDCIYFQSGGAAADLNKYTDAVIQQVVEQGDIPEEKIISVNEVTKRLVPTELASPLAVMIFELADNGVRHGFEKNAPINYLQVSLDLSNRQPTPETSSEEGRQNQQTTEYQLKVSNSGSKLSQFGDSKGSSNSGLALVERLVEQLDGSIQLNHLEGTQVSIQLPYPLASA